MEVPVQLSRNWKPAQVEGLPEVFTGGWVGYAGYDTVRYVYGSEYSEAEGTCRRKLLQLQWVLCDIVNHAACNARVPP